MITVIINKINPLNQFLYNKFMDTVSFYQLSCFMTYLTFITNVTIRNFLLYLILFIKSLLGLY